MIKPVTKVLVVGGAGYIGSSVVDNLVERNIPFTVYDNLLYEHQYLKPVDFVYGDIRDKDKLSKILSDYSHVVWLAAIVGDAACQINPSLSVSVNQESVKWLADNFNGRIIFISTCSVYGRNDGTASETSPVNLLSLYAKTKHQAEQYLNDKDHLIFRLGTVYGLSDEHARPRMDLVLNYMTANAITKGKLQVFGGKQWRPLVHVGDVAEVIVANLESDAQGVFNLATRNLQMEELASQVSKVTGCDIEWSEEKSEDPRSYRASTEKIKQTGLFKLSDARDIDYGIKQISDLVNSGRLKDIENDVYFNYKYLAKLFKDGKFS